jgi:hypothetical protein
MGIAGAMNHPLVLAHAYARALFAGTPAFIVFAQTRTIPCAGVATTGGAADARRGGGGEDGPVRFVAPFARETFTVVCARRGGHADGYGSVVGDERDESGRASAFRGPVLKVARGADPRRRRPEAMAERAWAPGATQGRAQPCRTGVVVWFGDDDHRARRVGGRRRRGAAEGDEAPEKCGEYREGVVARHASAWRKWCAILGALHSRGSCVAIFSRCDGRQRAPAFTARHARAGRSGAA